LKASSGRQVIRNPAQWARQAANPRLALAVMQFDQEAVSNQ
jgi:hypothetical protein